MEGQGVSTTTMRNGCSLCSQGSCTAHHAPMEGNALLSDHRFTPIHFCRSAKRTPASAQPGLDRLRIDVHSLTRSDPQSKLWPLLWLCLHPHPSFLLLFWIKLAVSGPCANGPGSAKSSSGAQKVSSSGSPPPSLPDAVYCRRSSSSSDD